MAHQDTTSTASRTHRLTALALGITLSLSPLAVYAESAAGSLWRGATYAAIAGLAYTNPFNADQFNFSAGAFDEHDAIQLEINFRYNLGEGRAIFSQSQLTPFVDLGYASWQESRNGIDLVNRGNAFTVAAGVRLSFPTFAYLVDFADARIGAGILAPSYFENDQGERRDFGGPFSFTEELAVGGYFSDKQAWEWRLAVQHYSNHNIYPQNAGMDFIKLGLGYNY
jgi:hypothetical protein